MVIFTSLEDIYIYYDISIDSIDKYKSIESYILELYNNDIIDSNTNDELKLSSIGNYYQYIEKDYELMKKYYLMAIDVGDSYAMYNLGNYYKYIEKDYELMKKYYLMAIDVGDSDAMNNLGNYYQDVEKDYELMKKYYSMAIDDGNSDAMINLATYYQDVEKDYPEMKKYYLMAIDAGNKFAMYNLAYYYQYVEKDYSEMKKYYGMAIDAGYTNAMYILGNYYYLIEKDYQLMKQYYLMAIDVINQNIMDNLDNLDNLNHSLMNYCLSSCMNNLGYYYQEIEKDYQMMKQYYLMAIEKNCLKAMDNLENYYSDNDVVEFYKELLKIKIKNDLVQNKINELEQLKPIQIFKNKVRLFTRLNNYTQCALCLEDNVINIDLSCGHEVCINCYNSNTKCIYNYCLDYT